MERLLWPLVSAGSLLDQESVIINHSAPTRGTGISKLIWCVQSSRGIYFELGLAE